MQSGRISSRNIGSLISMMVVSTTLLTGGLSTGQDGWISLLISTVLFLPIILIYCRICSLFPGKDIYEIADLVLGRALGSAVTLLLSVYALNITALVIRNFTEFTTVISLDNTPIIVLILFIGSASLYLVKCGIQTLGRWSAIAFVVITIFSVTTVFLSYSSIDPRNLLPIMEADGRTLINNALMLGSIAIGDNILMLTLVDNLRSKGKIYKAYLGGTLTGVFILLYMMLRNAMILGKSVVINAKFTSYLSVRLVNIGPFLERIDALLAFTFIILGITKVALALYATSKGAARLMGIRNPHDVATPIFMLAAALCSTVCRNMMDMFSFMSVYPIIAVFFQLVIPVVILIAAEIRLHKNPMLAETPN